MAEEAASTFRRVGLSYVYEPADPQTGLSIGVRFRATYLERKGQDITAEVVIESTLPGVASHLAQERINLSSQQTKKRFANALTERTPDTLLGPGNDWYTLVDSFCLSVLHVERRGEPFQVVGRMPPRERTVDLIDRILPDQQPTLLYGPGGIGKGWFVTSIAVAIAAGLPFAGYTASQGPVMYLDWEDFDYVLDDRVKRVSAGFGLVEPVEVIYRRCSGSLAAQLEQIMEESDRWGVRLIIVDSVTLAIGASSASTYEDKALSLFEALRYLPQAKLLVDHVSHETRKEKKGSEAAAPYGSRAKGDTARNAWEVRAVRDLTNDIGLGLYRYKVNHGVFGQPLGFSLHFDDPAGPVSIGRRDLRDDPELARGLSLVVRIEGALRDGAMKAEDVAKVISAPSDSVRVTLNRYALGKPNARFVQVMGNWGLLGGDRGEPTAAPPKEQTSFPDEEDIEDIPF